MLDMKLTWPQQSGFIDLIVQYFLHMVNTSLADLQSFLSVKMQMPKVPKTLKTSFFLVSSIKA